jgi:hypothetical protein
MPLPCGFCGLSATSSLTRLLFPTPARRIPRERAINVTFRSAHIVTSGILLGGHAFDIAPHRLEGLLWATLASGLGLIGLELYRSCRWLYLGQGAMVWLKLGLIAATSLWWEQRVLLLVPAALVASVGSHMSSQLRHYSLIHGRVLEEQD